MTRHHRYHKRGGSFLSELKDFAKKHKLISKGASHVIQHGPAWLKGIAKGIHTTARHHGYRRHRKRTGMRRHVKHGVLSHHKGHRKGGIGESIPPFPLALSTPLSIQNKGFRRNVGLALNVKGGRRHRKHRLGRGIFSDIHNFIKNNRLISKAGNAISGLLPAPFGAVGKSLSGLAEHYGYSRRKKHRKGGVAIVRNPVSSTNVGRIPMSDMGIRGLSGTRKSYGVHGGKKHHRKGGLIPFNYNNSMYGKVRF